ncbi:hypothetical protein DH2020_003789 [Rehmannia glutinosa]|uniref:Uncharacterized protein n=1 Tax=Rehmannia glutinosa TaxID=99300 RepID=A0ABR0XMZ3_REHGL
MFGISSATSVISFSDQLEALARIHKIEEDNYPKIAQVTHPSEAYGDGDFVDQLESSQPWNSWRDNLAVSIDESPQTPNPIDENDHTSTYNPQTSARSSDKSKKKRKQKNPGEYRFLDVLENFCDKTYARFADLAKRIGFEQDASSSRKAIFDALDQMTFLIVETKIAVATQLSNKTKELDIFFTLSDENKAVFVKMLLEGKI